MSIDDGSSNSGYVRGMPGVNQKLNEHAGERPGKLRTDGSSSSPVKLVALTNCVRPGCDAYCGAFRIDLGQIDPARVAVLAVDAGWIRLGPGKWLCPGCWEKMSDKQREELVQELHRQVRLAEIRREGGVVLG